MSQFEPRPFGKYFLTDRIAVGGMAEIYKAKTFGVDGFEKILAIKKILPHYSADKEFITMLTDEAKLVVNLSHANIVQVYDLGRVGDDYYISMEFIEGHNLRDLIEKAKERGERVPIEICLFVISEILKGLDYAHNKKDANGQPLHIIHRDVSPQNILVSVEGGVKLVDFGIAKAAMNLSETRVGLLKGKVTYMSPEQAFGKPIDSRTDLFSLGIVFYELLTNQRVFTGENQMQVLKKIRNTRFDEQSFTGVESPEVRAILAKALAYNAKERYASAADFQVELTRTLYSNYPHFTPRALSDLLKSWFGDQPQSVADRPADEVLVSQPSDLSQTGLPAFDPSEMAETLRPDDDYHPDQLIQVDQSEQDHPEHEVTEKTETSDVDLAVMGALPSTGRKRPFRLVATLLGLVLILVALWWSLSQTGDPSSRIAEQGSEVPSDESPIVPPKETPKVSETKTTPTPKEPEVQQPQTKRARVEISSSPAGASIQLDGQETGLVTPHTFDQFIFPRKVKITLALRGYQNDESELNVDKALTYKLNRPLKLAVSSAKVTSNIVGASVEVDGEVRGVTPLSLDLPWGKHRLVVKKKGYQTESLVWTADQSQKQVKSLYFRLRPDVSQSATKKPAPTPKKAQASDSSSSRKLPAKVSLRVDSNPRGAAVLMNGAPQGITPVVIPGLKSNQSYNIVVNKSGYQRWSKRVTLDKKRVEVQANLVR